VWIEQLFCWHEYKVIKKVRGVRWINNRPMVVFYLRCDDCDKQKEIQKEFILEEKRDVFYNRIAIGYRFVKECDH